MANHRLAALSDNDRQELDAWLVEFGEQWGDGALPERARRLPPTSSWRLPALCEMVKIDLERQWGLGNRLSLETYLQEYPELGNPSDVSADLIQAEYEVRNQFGAAADLDEYARRFPAQIDELRRLIAAGHSSLSFRSKSASNLKSATRRRAPADTAQELPEQFGRYRILNRLGAGGMGSVYLAEDTRLKRKVALKVTHISGPENRQVLERFHREAEAAAGLDHPYLCKVYDVDEIENVHYLTMEYIEGTTLAAFMAGQKDRSQRQVAAIVGKLALALQEAHAKGVVHRDLKPANVMIRKTGQKAPVIVDFGLAQQLDAGGTRLTQTGQAMGTPHYMAIEQIKGDLGAIGPASDIYALGVMLYELLTGNVPFDGPNPMVVVAQILTTRAAPPSSLRPDLDRKLEAICLKAMAREIKDRYASMAEFAAALSEYLKAPATAVSDASPVAAPEATGERPSHRQGSDTLMGRFLETPPVEKTSDPNITARPKVSPVAAPVPVPEAEAEGTRSRWPMIVGIAAVFVSLLCGVIVYVVTDKGVIKITVNGPKTAVKIDGDEVRLEQLDELITLRAGEHEMTVIYNNAETRTREFIVRRGVNKEKVIEYEPKTLDKPNANREAEKGPEPVQKALPGPETVASRTTPVPANETVDSKAMTDVSVPSGPISPGSRKTITNSIGMKLKLIPAGEFMMGSSKGDDNHVKDGELPRHRVCITRPFFLGVAEVTHGQYREMTGKDPSETKGADDLPVDSVSWQDAVAFCNTLSTRENVTPYYRVAGPSVTIAGGTGYRLPTEAEWEYACRAGTTTKYSFGDDNSRVGDFAWIGISGGPRPAGEKPANPFGLYDMHGNLFEWCWDAYDPGYYGRSPRDDPTGPEGGSNRVHRGGGFTHEPEATRSANRAGGEQFFRNLALGFRVARSPSAAELAASRPTPAPASEPGPNAQGRLKPITNSIGMKLAQIPAGEFLMGASQEEGPDAPPTDKPRHRVRITRPFYMGATEVTQGQYRAVTGQDPSQFHGSDDLPVDHVSWHDAIRFCNELSRKENLPSFYNVQGPKVAVPDWKGAGYRLPTEAEREYACRAGTTTRFACGPDDSDLGRYAWFNANSGMRSHPVGRKSPNAFGLFDMQGNVWEWCWDGFDPNYYSQSPVDDPTGPPNDDKRVDRGGSWRDVSFDDRSASRFGLEPGFKTENLGFRVARFPLPTAIANQAPLEAKVPGLDKSQEPLSSDEGRRAGERRDDNALKLKLCWCPPGSFRMGSPTNEPGRGGNEGPVNVTLSRGFWMGQFEVTQSQWQSIMGATIGGAGPDHPMDNVSHTQAEEFCRKLTESERGARRLPPGWEYRLPTEAQWEYACRAGTTTATAFGDRLSSREANFNGGAPYNGAAPGPFLNQTAPVGRYRSNPWGIHDMHGNVWEWCRDGTAGLSFFDNVEPLQGGVDPVGPGSLPGRVMRGGSWRIPGGDLRSAFRLPSPRDFRYSDLGFRVALVPSEQSQAQLNPGGSVPERRSPAPSGPPGQTAQLNPGGSVPEPGKKEADAKPDAPARSSPRYNQAAETLMGKAKNLEKARKTKSAVKAYEQIIQDFPGTEQALKAQARIDVIGDK